MTVPNSRRRRLNRLSLTVIAACAVVIAAVLIGSTLGGSSAKYNAHVTGQPIVLNPATIDVTVHVTNTGTAAGTPTCSINASGPGGSYTGFDEATLKGSLQPGQAATFTDQVVITGQGAQYVTSVTAACS